MAPGVPPTIGPVTEYGGIFSFSLIEPFTGGVDHSNKTVKGIWRCPGTRALDEYADVANAANWTAYNYLFSDYAYFARIDLWPAFATNPNEISGRNISASKVLMADGLFRWWVTKGWKINHGLHGQSTPYWFKNPNPGPPQFAGINELFGHGHVEWKSSRLFDLPKMDLVQATGAGVTPISHFVLGGASGGIPDATYYVP